MGELRSIVDQQIADQINGWEESVEAFPQSRSFWFDAEFHVNSLIYEKRALKAYEQLSWAELIPEKAKILDLGCGSGWLSALLSKEHNVEVIHALDASKHNLSYLLPEVVRLMDGNEKVIQPVLGLFDGLGRLNEKYDLVVASASLHHSMDIRSTLRCVNKILSDDGKLIVLNEFPSTRLRYIYRLLTGVAKALYCIVKKRYPLETPLLSSSGILYNRQLGDWTYCLDQWLAFFRETGFDAEVVPLAFSHKEQELKGIRMERLTHFVCKKK